MSSVVVIGFAHFAAKSTALTLPAYPLPAWR